MAAAVVAMNSYARADRKEPEALSRKLKWFRAWETNKQREINEARQARQYYHDKQWTDQEIQRLTARGQQPTVRNRIKRKIDFLVGVEQRLRRDPKAYPRTPQHEADADTATAGLRYVCDENSWPKISSDCMHDGLVSGIGVVFIGIQGQDPSLMEVPVDRFFYDPRSIKPDFSDARYMGLHLWLDIDEAKDRWPDKAKQLDDLLDASAGHTTSAVEQDREQSWGDFEGRRVRVVEFWEKRRWNGGMMQTTAMTPARNVAVDGWYYCFFTGSVELDSGESPYRGLDGEPDCPYVAWSPYIDEKGDRYGLVRTLKSIQDEVNYSASKMLHRLSTRQFYWKQGAVADVDQFARELAKPDGRPELNEHAEWGKDVGLVDDNVQLQGEAERHQLAIQEMENYGPNPGLVGQGQGVDGASGRALLAQRDSGMTELSPVFERQRDWKLRCYRKMWARIRQAWTAERWIRITDDSRSVQFVPINQYQIDPMTGQIMGQNVIAQIDVDIILEEGPDTITMNEELLDQFTKLGEAAMSPLGKVVIELSNTPKKEQLLKMIDEGMQAMQPGPDPALAVEAQKHEAAMIQLQAKAEQDREKGAREIALKDKDLELKELEIVSRRIELQASIEEKRIELDGKERDLEIEERRHALEAQREDRKHALELHKMEREDELRERDAQRADAAEERKVIRERQRDKEKAAASQPKPTPVKLIRGKDGRTARFEKDGQLYDVERDRSGRAIAYRPAETVTIPADIGAREVG